MCLLQATRENCLHCGNGAADYCEKCYQDLIGQNAKLQAEKDCYKSALDGIRKKIKGNHIPRID